MLAGVGAADFTPEPGLILQGHLSKNPAHAVLYPLEARALVLRSGETTVCLITLDVIGIDLAFTNRLRDKLSAELAIPRENIVVFASHTHCAPAMLANLAMTPDPRFVAQVEAAAVESAVDA